ncbi:MULTISPECIES: type IV-A pilus assembly ATPase PilB [unclassified Agarivorans]|uniref:type IV-A pilus assembly ATPase PilB n=1 Tax=unclassified Agarivorans TaxID=2636026 RepID=UPI0026E25D95|nr:MULTISPECIES: type IV-A pilus assembly ATPase PilB [unclassified Agarivorans]MDO6686926.1 type IV-A pilus assembly ATPase PilB [Agarivorans sp. 3_MG-2023]MDO6716723.1 type IV-A pilus assembly ATPase PilB [Agarivorans sp. 2_MG-2023]
MSVEIKLNGLASSLAVSFPEKETQLVELFKRCIQEQRAFTTVLVENELISSKDLADFCEAQFGIPLLDLDAIELTEIPQDYLNEKLIFKHHVLPVYSQNQTLYVAMADPSNVVALEDFGFSFGLHVEALLVEETKLLKAIQSLVDDTANLDIGDISDEDISDLEVSDENSRLDEKQNNKEDDAPIVVYINKILMDSIRRGASDLHFEPYEHKYRIRFRIDGILHEIASPPINLANRFSARLKVMARMDIAERRLPQDGRIKLKTGRNKAIDMRVNSLPTMWGEKIVIRILDSSAANLNIDILGYDDKQKKLYLDALARPQGMILVTGPTGSGKTVSLYTGLNILNTTETNISTAEDPVEINLPGVNQVLINNKAGMTFASALRAFLRQDPDIVMVGEIRDLETAEISIKAAQTGHLVLSTLHTNSAAETLTRLLNMGVPAFNIASSVSLIIAQRLARKLCEHCKKPKMVEAILLPKMGFTQTQIDSGIKLFEPVGCDKCTGGYKGRVGIYEVMPMSTEISKLIMLEGNSIQIAEQAAIEGMYSLRMSALEKARLGVTSLSEVERVTNV